MSMTTAAPSRARADHRASIEHFVETANAVPNDAWEQPLAPGKWSPAQVAEHLRLTYETVLRERSGGTGLRVRSKWWLRPILRFRVLPMILQRGVVPRGAKAPREIRPSEGPFERAPLLAAIEELAERAEDSLAGARDSDAGFTHHVFGALPASQALRFATVHNNHHARQLEVAAGHR